MKSIKIMSLGLLIVGSICVADSQKPISYLQALEIKFEPESELEHKINYKALIPDCLISTIQLSQSFSDESNIKEKTLKWFKIEETPYPSSKQIKKSKKLLLSGIDVNAKNKNSDTPLMILIKKISSLNIEEEKENTEKIELLLKCNNINIDIENSDGNTSFDLFLYELFSFQCLINFTKKPEILPLLKDEESKLHIKDEESKLHKIFNLFIKQGAKLQNNFFTALINEILSGKKNFIETFIQGKFDVNTSLKLMNITPLGCACMYGNEDFVKYLIKNGAKVNAKTVYGNTPLIIAAISGNNEIVTFLIKHKADVNIKNNVGGTALIEAASEALKETVQILLNAGADVNAIDNSGESALLESAKTVSPETIALLIEHGAKVKTESPETIALLIEHGAKVNLKNECGRTALMNASFYGDTESVRILLAAGANVNDVNNVGESALFEASISNSPEVISILIEHGAIVDLKNKNYKATPLMQASRWGNIESTRTLLKAEADAKATDENGKTALDIAVENKHEDIANLLREHAKNKCNI